uniref:Uncharacterized protein n=1 Tax=Vespula pensylvanica TaxID=30213 RepID=A0A834NQK1_VESPE|nr:hypothetical protein H0235_012267 [Vespula pensylvanica]
MFGVTFLRITIKPITNDDRGQLYGLPSLMAASLGDSRQPGSKAALLLLRTPTCLAFRMEITNDDLNEYTSATRCCPACSIMLLNSRRVAFEGISEYFTQLDCNSVFTPPKILSLEFKEDPKLPFFARGTRIRSSNLPRG